MTRSCNTELARLLAVIPEGWTRVMVEDQAWGVTRTTHARGKVISLEARRLGDSEQLGANIWIVHEEPVLRPCEVPAETVLDFLRAAAKTS